MTRNEYDLLLLEAGRQIHELGCWHVLIDEPCPHKIGLGSAECLQAHVAFDVFLAHLGLEPPQEPTTGVEPLW